MSEIIPLKRCSRKSHCIHPEARDGWLPSSNNYFQTDRSRKDGLRGTCKSCVAAGQKVYRENNSDKLREMKRQYYLANREQVIAKQLTYHGAHRDERLEYFRQYRLRNTPALRERNRQWRGANREHLARNMRDWKANNRAKAKTNETKRRARKRNLPVAFIDRDWASALNHFGGCCAVCKRQPGLWHTLAADHWIPLNSPECPGTVPWNIVPLCHGVDGCNNQKGAREPSEWLIEKLGKRAAKRKLAEINRFLSDAKAKEMCT
jgi:hypothetical protein